MLSLSSNKKEVALISGAGGIIGASAAITDKGENKASINARRLQQYAKRLWGIVIYNS